jgi:hypothetical protein
MGGFGMSFQNEIDVGEVLGDFIEHYGVKGMRWGVRRSQTQRDSEDYAQTESLKKKLSTANNKRPGAGGKTFSTHVLSNDELRVLTDRMQLEQNYRRLITKEQELVYYNSKLQKGKRFAKKAFTAGKGVYSAGKTLHKFSKSPMGRQIKDALLKEKMSKSR